MSVIISKYNPVMISYEYCKALIKRFSWLNAHPRGLKIWALNGISTVIKYTIFKFLTHDSKNF